MTDAVPTTNEPGREATEGDVAATYCATLVDEWVRLGLTDAVLSPGSRSTPLAIALAVHGQVAVHVHHDERSASFMALGLALTTGRPALVLCTSGTAATEFHSAVVEAHQACVPLMVVTADRPPELQGVGAPQTIDQRDLYGSAVRWFCEPGPPAASGAPWWRDLARDAWTRCHGERPGPVHLNLAFREPLLGVVGDLPQEGEPLRRPTVGAQWGLVEEELGRLGTAISSRRGVIVAGVRAAAEPQDVEAIFALADALRWPVIADGPSGCRTDAGRCVTAADALLRCEEFAGEHRPEVVLRIGGLLTSKVLSRWLAESGALQVGLDRYGNVADPDRVVQRSIAADVALVCNGLASIVSGPAPESWLDAWSDADRVARRAITRVMSSYLEATEPAAAVDLMNLLSDGGVVVASSSMPVRDLEWFAQPRGGLRVLSNRGANGIDGVCSTAVGAALTGAPTALLVGDVAFLHDSNALVGLSSREVNLVIVVLDNDGGGIFSFLPQRDLLDPAVFEPLFGTPHGVDLVALCEAHGVPAERVGTRTGVTAAIAGALTRGGPRVVVVDSDRDRNVEVHAAINDAVRMAMDESALQ